MGNEYFDSAVKRYENISEKDYLINPISKIDLKILLILVDIIKNNVDKNIVSLFNSYKLLKDEDILKDLIKFSKEIKNKKNDIKEDKLPYWIQFKDLTKLKILRLNVISYQKYDENENNPGILLNKCSEKMTKVPMHANEILEYSSEELRDEDLSLLNLLTNY